MQLLEKSMLKAAQLVAPFNYPTSFERLEIDENRAVWVDGTPDYTPAAPLQANVQADVAIIGGGFTGMSMAYHFSQRYPDKKVVLLEAKTLANGASGRNGGMVLNWINGVEDASPELTKLIYETTRSGIDLLENLIKEHKLPVSFRRDGSLINHTSAAYAEYAHQKVEALQQLGLPLQFWDTTTLRARINFDHTYGATFDPTEGQINGAQLVRSLRPIVEGRGVVIYENTPVLKVQEGRTMTLTTPAGSVQANAIVLATNGYTGKLGYFRKAVFPLLSHVFATAPLTPEQLREVGWHQVSGYSDDVDRISYSSLSRDGRIVFGGGSNTAYDYLFNNRTAYPGQSVKAFQSMHATMLKYLPGLRNIPITHKWSGTLAISFKRNCAIGVMGEYRNVYYALGYSGHGVVLANLAGKVLTDIYSGDDHQWRKLPFYHADFAPIPLEPFRWIGYQIFTRLTGRSPRL